MAKIPGIEFDFGGGKVYTLAPLTLGDLETLQERIAQVNPAAINRAAAETIIDTALASIQRNHPEVKRDDVKQLVDLSNMLDVFGAAMDVGGVRRKEVEAKKAQAQAQTTARTGAPSSPESAQTPAGPGTMSETT
jgi:hypothetical protein